MAELNEALLPKWITANDGSGKIVSTPVGLGYNVFIKVENGVTDAVYIFVLDGGQAGAIASTARKDLAIKLACTTANQGPLVRDLTNWFARAGNTNITSGYNSRHLMLDEDNLAGIVAQGIDTPITAVTIDADANA